MTPAPSRRQFLGQTLRTSAVLGLGNWCFLRSLPPVAAEEAEVSPITVSLSSDLEPLVRHIENTPREKIFELAASLIRQGTSYQQLMSAVFLAGVRGIMPRPVGFQFHAVLVINSAHLASLAAPDRDRWLPWFWALDNFKKSQATHRAQHGNWMLPPVQESKLPSPTQGRQRLIDALDHWDAEAADVAAAALVRSAGATEVWSVLWRYGARDFRDIGHKAIYMANSWRCLQTIGWRHAEPVVRSLVFALLEHEGQSPASRDDERDRPGRQNLDRLHKIRPDWQRGRSAQAATVDLLAALRTASPAEAGDLIVALLNQGIDPAALWDGLFLRAAELLMRQPGIIGVHCVTSANALYYAYQTAGADDVRKFLLLQTAAFLVLFRKFMHDTDTPSTIRIDTLEKASLGSSGGDAIPEILSEISHDRLLAARKLLAWLSLHGADAPTLMTAARRLIFTKGTNAHDYKFSSAALEDFYHVSPAWRDRYMAASTAFLRGSADPDNDLIHRVQTALGPAF